MAALMSRLHGGNAIAQRQQGGIPYMLPVAQTILRNLFGLAHFLDESPTATTVITGTPATTVTPVAPATPAAAVATPVATVTPGIAATPTPIPPTATPLPSPWNPSQWLKTTGWTADFHAVFLVIYIVIAIAAVVVYFYLYQRRFKDHALHARLAERISLILTGAATLGLLLLLFAAARASLLAAPIWLIISLVVLIAAAVYGIYYYVNIYPVELAKYQHEQERLRYLPKAKTKGPAYTPPMKRKQARQGKQDKKKQKR
jgi:hypothetical protein